MKLEPILFCPDAHHPYADAKAWELFIKAGKEIRPKHIVVIGDFADFFSVSSHSKSPERANILQSEIEIVNSKLDELDSLGAKNKKFIAGNHCNRLERYIEDKAPELFGLVTIPELLKLEDRNWDYTPYKCATQLGKLHLTHDVGAAGRNATFKALDTFQHSNVTGHAHRMQYIVEGNAAGEQKLAAQFGWLGDVNQVDYMHKFNVLKNWALGFGIGYMHSKTEIVYCTPVPIINGGDNYSCMINGKLLEVKCG